MNDWHGNSKTSFCFYLLWIWLKITQVTHSLKQKNTTAFQKPINYKACCNQTRLDIIIAKLGIRLQSTWYWWKLIRIEEINLFENKLREQKLKIRPTKNKSDNISFANLRSTISGEFLTFIRLRCSLFHEFICGFQAESH